ncbi:MAG: hypothetical protein SFU53_12010 [Terrimicrobiaceae bacterium]|nr:hypothetical protein [Terrimicrobiaceae bacterium]
MPDEDSVSKLLRLKRYEQPPPGYFENFLVEFQTRQRAELLRQSPWERFNDWIASIAPSFEVPRLAYAAMVVCAIGASALIMGRPDGDSAGLAANSVPTPPLTLSSPSAASIPIGEPQPVALTSTGSPSVHYVLPTRPVSYASSRSF